MSVVQHSRKEALMPEITLSEAARAHFIKALSAEPQLVGIRLSIKKTGCSGYAYLVDYVQESKESDLSIALSADYQLYVDKGSLPYLQGLVIDYVKQGLNHKLDFHNPNQTGQCGCGESFTID